jgi:hypothetical protein
MLDKYRLFLTTLQREGKCDSVAAEATTRTVSGRVAAPSARHYVSLRLVAGQRCGCPGRALPSTPATPLRLTSTGLSLAASALTSMPSWIVKRKRRHGHRTIETLDRAHSSFTAKLKCRTAGVPPSARSP